MNTAAETLCSERRHNMPVVYHEQTRIFHLYNEQMSYILQILPEGFPVQLYTGAALPDRACYDYLFETAYTPRPMQVTVHEQGSSLSLESARLEYPMALSGDMREGALDIQFPDGSRIADFVYVSHEILPGKPALPGLPACYVEKEEEAQTLLLTLQDRLSQARVVLSYTIYTDRPVLCRSAEIFNDGQEMFRVNKMMSLSLDLPDDRWDMMVLAGAWSRERNIEVHPLHTGIQSIYSLRGHSSHNYNPFLCLKRPLTGEENGECLGFSLVYSGNFLASVDADTWHTARVSLGIHPYTFSWPLQPGESFQSPEAVLVYSDTGLNAMSQSFHSLFRERLARGVWKDQVRPILLNSWEGVYFDVQEEQILDMARAGKDLGIELFVLDDGWFEGRNDDTSSLGDWVSDLKKLPGGVAGLSRKVEDMGLKFGLWFEPEMVSMNSNLFREHPEWLMHVPGRRISAGRKQYVLDFSNPEAVDYIAQMMETVLDESRISYIKWDMNRSLSEVYSSNWKPEEQGTVYHRYILGVYALYERLTSRYPDILFESCASGGARFDPGMLYYAPQAWTSDDTDAIERLKIQFGTSMLYPISSMGSHVSAAPNHQLNRFTPLSTRGNVAYFGTFGYELDPLQLSEEEKAEIQDQIRFMKEYRNVIQFGTFYRLASPFEGNETAWMIVSQDRKTAIVGYYRTLQEVNAVFRRLKLQGLQEEALYTITGRQGTYSGRELEKAGMIITDSSAAENSVNKEEGDFLSRIWVLQASEEHNEKN